MGVWMAVTAGADAEILTHQGVTLRQARTRRSGFGGTLWVDTPATL
jgi:hypothetical protein